MNNISKVTARAPASSANLGPGFDVFALALEEPFDLVEIARVAEKEIAIQMDGESSRGIPTDPSDNSSGLVAEAVFERYDLTGGCKIKILKGIRPGFGLGSSAASAAATAFGLNTLFDLRLSTDQIIGLAAEGEKASAGVAHYDNVSASLLGGFTIVKPGGLEALSITPPVDLKVAIAYPLIETPPKKTGVARSVIPKSVDLKMMTHNLAAATSMVAGFLRGDIALIGRNMCDVVVEPARAGLVPAYGRVKEEALRVGASGVAISGAGPSMLAVVDGSKVSPLTVAEAMRRSLEAEGFKAHSFATQPGRGVQLMEAA